MKPTTLTIFELFEKERRYIVPLFQRPYVWSQEKQWATLWEDIATKADELLDAEDTQVELGKHFLGAAVLNEVKTFGRQVAAREIIDGQQRLTTLQIILVALRDIVQLLEDESANRTLNRLTKNDCKMEQPTEAYKVWPTTSDRKDFEAIFNAGDAQQIEARYPLKRIPRTQRYHPRPRLVEAYLFFHKEVLDYINDAEADSKEQANSTQISMKRLDALTDSITKYMELVVIELEERDNPQVIFETLNATGEPLLPSDLIRNFVFMEANRLHESVDELYHAYWQDYDEGSAQFWKDEDRQGRLKRPRIDLFMFHYLVYKTGRDLLITQLFQEFRRWWEGYVKGRSVEIVLKEIQAYSALYRSFFATDVKSRLGLLVKRLRILDTSTVYPLLLYLYGEEANIVQSEREGVIADLESYLIRRMICQLPTKNYNRLFLTMLRNFRRAEKIDRAVVRGFLLELTGDNARWPDNDEFKRCWMAYPTYLQLTQRRVSMILEAVDLQLETNKQEQLHILDNLSIEHIRPQHPRSELEWPSIENPDLIHTFGNLTLLTQPLNSAVSNGPFAQKRPEIAKQSRLRLNAYFQDFSNTDQWTEDRIRERGQILLEVATAIWPVPLVPPSQGISISQRQIPQIRSVEDYNSPLDKAIRDFQEIYEYLQQVAREERTVPYNEISRMAGLSTDTQVERNELGRILGAISEYEHEHNRPLLSVVTVLAEEGVPSQGFFKLARDLGRLSGSDEMAELTFFAYELKAAYEYWKAH